MQQADILKSDSRLRIAIIGSGAAGLACAEKAVERGAQVTLIEHRKPGGVNVDILPASLEASVRAHFDQPHSNAPQATERRLKRLLQARNFRLMEAEARFLERDKLIVRLNDDSRKVSFRKVPFDRCLIASGAIPDLPPIAGLGDTPFWTPNEALATKAVPASLMVIGATDVASQLARMFASLGSRVSMLISESHASPQLLHNEGITIYENIRIEEAAFEDGRFSLDTDHGTLNADRLLVAAGYAPNTFSLCLDMIGVELGPEGHVLVDERLQTNVAGIFAAGGCINLPRNAMLSAKAGEIAAINMTGGQAVLDEDLFR